jgi:hypothetical protein
MSSVMREIWGWLEGSVLSRVVAIERSGDSSPQSRGSGAPDSYFLTGSGCLWTKGDDFAGGGAGEGSRLPGKKCFQVPKSPDHAFKCRYGLGDNPRLLIDGDKQRFLADKLQNLIVWQ